VFRHKLEAARGAPGDIDRTSPPITQALIPNPKFGAVQASGDARPPQLGNDWTGDAKAKTLGKHSDAVHCPIPFTGRDRAET
jgi:hypothetical protein